jgi:hypothetical protein
MIPYAKPLIYLGDYDLCLRCRDGAWACVFREPPLGIPTADYEVRYFESLEDAIKFKYGHGVKRVEELGGMICVELEDGSGYCHTDTL